MKAVGWILFLTGLLVLLGSAWYAFEASRFLADTQSTTGEIVEHKFTGGLQSNSREVGSHQTKVTAMYAPIVNFRTHGGRQVRFQANWSEGEPPGIGTSVRVRYSEARPEDARISGFSSLFGGALILLIFGAVLAGSGGLIIRARGRKGPPAV